MSNVSQIKLSDVVYDISDKTIRNLLVTTEITGIATHAYKTHEYLLMELQ